MEPVFEKVEHLTLWTLPAEKTLHTKSTDILILGNAYGIMPYQLPLAKMFSERGLQSWWFAFSGQEGTRGELSRDRWLRDLAIVSDHIFNVSGDPFYTIAHCASGLLVLEYLRQNPDAPIANLIFYGLLFNMNRRREAALPKLRKYGIKVGLTEQDWNYNPLQALNHLRIPVLFCHAKDKLNLSRATEEEMGLVAKTVPYSELVWFDNGYDTQLDSLPDFFECYFSWFQNSKITETKMIL